MSIQDQAYNTALKSGYLAQVSTDAREQISRISAQYPNDQKAFQANARQYTQGLLQGVGDDFRDDIEATVNNYVANAETSVFKNEIIKNRASAEASVRSRLDGLLLEINEVSSGGDREQAENSLLEYQTLISSQVAIEAIDLDVAESKIRIARNKLESGLLKSELQPDLESNNHADAYKKLQAFDRPESFTPDEWESFKANAGSTISRDQSIYNASKTVADQEAKNSFKDYARAKGAGFEVSPEETAKIEALAAEYPEFQKAFALIQDVEAFSLNNAEDRSRKIQEGQTGNIEDSAEFAAMVTANTEINKMAEEDAYTLGVNQSIIEKVDFDPSEPNTLEQRVLQASALSEHYGVEASPLTNPELLTLTSALPKMTPDEKVVLAETLAIAPELWGDIAKKGGGTFAMAGATGDRNVMSAVFRGQELIENKLVAPIKPSDYLGSFTDMVGGVYLAEDAMNVKNASLAYYATMGAEGYDSELFEDAVTAVTGGIAEINGFKIELPRGVGSEVFSDFIDHLEPGTVAAMGGVRGMTDEEAAETIRRSALIGVKSGGYRIESNLGTLLNEDGSVFILNWDDEQAEMNEIRNKKRRNENISNPRGRIR
tara:strand:+ start:34 stop:1842 length:1809 start_codon:yes stop_codon:yes gene_type:complete